MLISRGALLGLLVLSGACRSRPEEAPSTPPQPPSAAPAADQRTRDSILGASTLPGAGAIRGALRARDTLEARGSRIQPP